jgi:hypothetical protein
MFKTLVFVALFVAAIAQAPIRPQLSNSFTANVDLVDNFRGHMNSFHGQWYVNALGRIEAFDATVKHFGRVDFFHFYNQSKAYEYRAKHDICRQMADTRPFYGAFDWVQYAKLNGNCKKYGTSTVGHKWEWHVKDKKGGNILTLDLCASDDSQTPYWLRIKDHQKDFHREVMFKDYTPGVPKPSFFQLPPACNNTETLVVETEAEAEARDLSIEDAEGYVSLAHMQMKFDLKCSLCQAVIAGVREAINGDDSQGAVSSALQHVCHSLKFASEICSTLLAPMIQQIALDLANQYTDRKVCDDISACSPQ